MMRCFLFVLGVLMFVSSANALVNVNQGDAIFANLGVINSGPGLLQGSNVAQVGGMTLATDGVNMAGASRSALVMQGATVAGPGAALTTASLVGGQTAGAVTNASGGTQGVGMSLGTMVLKAPGFGGIVAQNSAIANQTEQTVTPTTMTSNSQTVGASTLAAAGPCSAGIVTSTVDIQVCQGAVAVAACPVNPCPPPPCNPCL